MIMNIYGLWWHAWHLLPASYNKNTRKHNKFFNQINEKRVSMYVSTASCKSTGSGQFCTHQGVALLRDLALLPVSSLVPRPSPNFPSLAVRLNHTASDGKLGNRTASDGKLGEGLGMRLTSVWLSCFLYTYYLYDNDIYSLWGQCLAYSTGKLYIPGRCLIKPLMKHYQA